MELQRLSSLSKQAEPVLKETKGKGIVLVASMVDIKVNYGLFEIDLILGNKIDCACSSILLAAKCYVVNIVVMN